MFSNFAKLSHERATLKSEPRNDLHYYEIGNTDDGKYYLDYVCVHAYDKQWVEVFGGGYWLDKLVTHKLRVLENHSLEFVKLEAARHPERQVFFAWHSGSNYEFEDEPIVRQYTGVE
jgi:hypothetical protein